MSTPANPAPRLDFSALTFPSDRITVGDLRRTHPDRFNPPLGQAFNSLETDRTFSLNDAIYLERLLAREEFERAASQPGSNTFSHLRVPHEGFLDTLTNIYQQYGLVTGRKQTEQLVRKLEAEAAKQVGLSR